LSIGFLGAALVVPALVGATFAFACVPQPLVTLEPRASGAAGSQVTVTASALGDDAEIRWNALDGPELGTGTGPRFSQTVTIPTVADGLYSVLVLERKPDGSVGSTARAAFLVTPGIGGITSLPTRNATGTATPPRRASSRSGMTDAGWAVGLVAVGLLGGVAVASRRRRT